MTTSGGPSEVEHEITVAAPAAAVYRLIAEVGNWPRIFPPTIHVEHVERGEHEERIRIWATANGEVRNWISRRVLDPAALRQAVGSLSAWTADREPDLVLGAEARGFLLGAAIACEVGCGFVPARRPGKLPPETVSARYVLEYGENALEVNADAIRKGARVVIHDDVLATGGTVEAIGGLIEQLGGHVVGVNFVIELSFLGGRERLAGYDLFSLIVY